MRSFLQRCTRFSTYQTIALTFAALITCGTLLLMLPFASTTGQPLDFLDALFTATSASCVTGLTVVDTGRYFTLFGQIVILLLIQLGGLGLMTFATLFSVAFGKKISLQERLRIQESLNESELTGVVKMCLHIFKFTLLIEFFFGSLLALCFYDTLGLKGVYFGYWHAVSAFCNAGFDLFGDFVSLTNYAANLPVNLIITTLITLGSLGFTVMEDVLQKKNFKHLRLHSKLVLTTTAVLTVVGTLGFLFLESGNTMATLPLNERVLISYFQAVTPRTAGFNTIDLGNLRTVSFMFMIVLMFIGASPASTGGGVKTTTFALCILAIRNLLHGNPELVIFDRRVEDTYVHRAFSILGLAVLWIVGATMLVANFEAANMEIIMFEVVSAFATVGLSTGLSQHLTEPSKVVLILTMFAGRVGIMTFAMALVGKGKPENVRYPKEKIMIG